MADDNDPIESLFESNPPGEQGSRKERPSRQPTYTSPTRGATFGIWSKQFMDGPSKPAQALLLGSSVQLMPTASLATILSMRLNGVHRLLRYLRVPIVRLGPFCYFSMQAFEVALFCLAAFGGDQFIGPGTTRKNLGPNHPRNKGRARTAFSDEDIKYIRENYESIRKEMKEISLTRAKSTAEAVRQLVKIVSASPLAGGSLATPDEPLDPLQQSRLRESLLSRPGPSETSPDV